ncbi:MAG: NAD(P)/FAD-dependent oxidoreductase [Anaeroplasmataceae bacterium]
MIIKINSFKVSIKNSKVDLKTLIYRKYNFTSGIKSVIVSKESIDARDKANIFIMYNLIVDIYEDKYLLLKDNKFITVHEEVKTKVTYPSIAFKHRPVIIGFGPSSMFAALYMARCNLKPIVIERGSDVDTRIKKVDDFINNKILDENTNIQFGEGGAGTFSDGKLTTNVKDDLVTFILEQLVLFGAPKEILYESKPHIGTDYLSIIVKNLRQEIISLGGSIYFDHKFTDFTKINNDEVEVHVEGKDINKLVTNHLIIGVGHSARDTIRMLHNNNVNMEAKSFSIGLRVEHKREYINKVQFSGNHIHLKAAEYKLSCHLDNNRSVYTFCMCPGGQVMASQNQKNTILTNGMSKRDRDEENSNSAILVNIDPSDYQKTSVLDGLDYQEKYEKLAFEISGDYKAPANLMKEFLNNKVANSTRSIKTSYPHGLFMSDFTRCLPDFVVDSIKKALLIFDKKMKGFIHNDAILIGVETRSSCPVRILRDESRKSNITSIYPIGEGAGYAGGITSACLDGLKTAISICSKGE